MMMTVFMDCLSYPIFIPLITTSFLVLSLYIYNRQRQQRGKKYHPTVGTVFHMFINLNTLHDYMTKLSTKYKTFRMFNPLQSAVYTTDPTNVEYILKTNFKNYGKGPYFREMMMELLGEGIFTVDGDQWREQRKVASHEFSTRVLRDFSSTVFRKNAIKLGNILSQAANDNQVVDLNNLFMKATTDSIFKVGFGIDLDNLSGTNEEGVRFSRAFDDANHWSVLRFVDISWKIKKVLNIGSEAELRKDTKVINDFVYKVIKIKIEQMQKSNDEFSLKKEDILSRFVQIKENDPKYLRDVILNFVLAGKDPIAISMSWFVYELCKHPDIQDKVAKEIKEAMNMKEDIINVEDFAALMSDDLLDKMQYLQAALTETIRLYPALAMDTKTCFSDDVLPDGCHVKKGEMVYYLPYAMGKMKYIWGDDAHEFKPERWLDDNGRFHPESPFKFTAFQAGPRTCLGRDFAYKQLKIFSSILLGCFEFKLSDENNLVTYKFSINIHVKGQLQIRVFKRFGSHDP